ncbi:MAG: hypothetical protein M1833_001133 [Piccolia ochrophora]|nr:MAG: hypothetical protein M1833_001133 [Piccolia ochrophora]
MAYSSASSSPQSFHFNISSSSGADLYDGVSDLSSPDSPLPFDPMCSPLDNLSYSMFPYSASTSNCFVPQPNNIPMELISEHSMAMCDRRRRKTYAGDGEVSSHVHSRRRAQNRASQRAFRDRKEKHVKDLETRLEELEAKHQTLEQRYSDLRKEHSRVKEEMEKMSTENEVLQNSSEDGLSKLLHDRDFGASSGDGLLYMDPTSYFEDELQSVKQEV